jgi:hypothetical protein
MTEANAELELLWAKLENGPLHFVAAYPINLREYFPNLYEEMRQLDESFIREALDDKIEGWLATRIDVVRPSRDAVEGSRNSSQADLVLDGLDKLAAQVNESDGGGSVVFGLNSHNEWMASAEWGREAPGSPMAAAARYGHGKTFREAAEELLS